MTQTLRALDLFCGAGGAAEGLFNAGFDEVVGIDINKRNGPPYPGSFLCHDVRNLKKTDLKGYDFIWASPPCQRWATGTKKEKRASHPDFIDFTRNLLKDHPFSCIENVERSPIRGDLWLTGEVVGLTKILRVRKFELSFPPPFRLIPRVKIPRKEWIQRGMVTITGSMSASSHYYYRKDKGLKGRLTREEAMNAMGITDKARTHTLTAKQIGEAVPPAYSEFIGKEVIALIRKHTETR